MSHERHDSKTGEGTTSGQYYAFLQDKITVKNNTSKALLSIPREDYSTMVSISEEMYIQKNLVTIYMRYCTCVVFWPAH